MEYVNLIAILAHWGYFSCFFIKISSMNCNFYFLFYFYTFLCKRSNLSFNYFMKYILYVPTFHKGVYFVKFIVVPVLTKFLICFKSLNNVVLSKIVLYAVC